MLCGASNLLSNNDQGGSVPTSSASANTYVEYTIGRNNTNLTLNKRGINTVTEKKIRFRQNIALFVHQKGDLFVRLFAMDNSLLEGDVARPFLHKLVVEKQFVLYRNVRFF